MAPSSSPPAYAGTEDESRPSQSTRDTSEEWTEDDDIDDDEYEPAQTGDEYDGEEGSDGVEYLDALADLDEETGDLPNIMELLGGGEDTETEDMQILAEVEEEVSDNEGEGEAGTGAPTAAATAATTTTATPRPVQMTITRDELLQLITQTGFRRIFYSGRGTRGRLVDDDDDDEDYYPGMRTRRRPNRTAVPFPKIPSDEGRELMESGVFGTNERPESSMRPRKRLARKILERELGIGSSGRQRSINMLASQTMIPASTADSIIHYDNRCYSGQFSDDGNFFFSCSQDFNVRMYDTSNPYKWRYYKTVTYPYGQWTLTDASLSPDNKYLAYSSIKSIVCLASTDPDSGSDPYLLDFTERTGSRARGHAYGYEHFGIWSLRFSGDGREIVAGTGDNSVYVFDLESRRTILRIPGHTEDVNAVCYGDKSSPHLLYSGSDDTTLKVWDRRSLGDKRAAGVFLGHTEGITYIDSKGDGRYVLSNGKDQTMRLFDLRKMVSTEKADATDHSQYNSGFDYRFQDYPDDSYNKHPDDCSVVVFRKHKVLKTLIRCHFSPPGSTDSRYVYTGSEDGSVYVYNMDATLAGKVDVNKATHASRPRGDEDLEMLSYSSQRHGGSWKTCVRDASWHPSAPVIAATSWNGYGMTQGTCTLHTWNDGMEDDDAEPKMGLRVDERLRQNPRFYDGEAGTTRHSTARTRARSQRRAARADNNE